MDRGDYRRVGEATSPSSKIRPPSGRWTSTGSPSRRGGGRRPTAASPAHDGPTFRKDCTVRSRFRQVACGTSPGQLVDYTANPAAPLSD